jgi:hypothetical protein
MKTEIGVYTIGPSIDVLFKRFTVKFEKNFQSPPVFVANTLQGTNYPQDIPDTFAVSLKSINEKEAVVQVWRVDNPNNPKVARGWAQNLRLCWIAIGEN